MKHLTDFWDWVDARGIKRSVVLGVAIYQTWLVTIWAMDFASNSLRPGGDIAMIIGAVSLPCSTFAGFVFRAYLESKPL